jgi:hypothetical protein
MSKRVSLIDPLMHESSYINRTDTPSLFSRFYKKFNLVNFSLTIILPLCTFIAFIFVLKNRYNMKQLHPEYTNTPPEYTNISPEYTNTSPEYTNTSPKYPIY